MRRFLLAGAIVGLLLFLWSIVVQPHLERREVRSLLQQHTDAKAVELKGDYDVGVSALVRSSSSAEIGFGALWPSSFAAPEAVLVHSVNNLLAYKIRCHPSEDRTVLEPALVAFYAEPSQGAPTVRNVQDAIAKASSLRSYFVGLPDCFSSDAEPVTGTLCRVYADHKIGDTDLVPCRVSH